MTSRKPTPTILDEIFSGHEPVTTLAPQPTQLPIASIRRDGATQMRAGLNAATVAEYAADMTSDWGDFPAVVVYYDGSAYWLADGFHRIEAYLAGGGIREQHTVPCDIRTGTRRDAILHAASANSSHGLRRSNADKRRSVETLLRDEEWRQWSDREIAERCHVDHKTVASIRKSLSGEIPQIEQTEQPEKARTVSRKGSTYTMRTQAINAGRQPSQAEERPLETAVPVMPAPASTAPVTMPADMAARGWELRQVAGNGRWYAYNHDGHRATGVHDAPGAAIAEARTMQVDVRQPEPEPVEVQTAEQMWNLATAQGVLVNVATYWGMVPKFALYFEPVDLNRGQIKVNLGMLLPDGGWHHWEGATLEEVFHKAVLKLG